MPTYRCDPNRHIHLVATIGNGHSGFIEVARPPAGSAKERIARDLGPGRDLINTTISVFAAVTRRNAKPALLTVDLYQIDAAGKRVNEKSFSDSRPFAAGKTKVNLRVLIDVI